MDRDQVARECSSLGAKATRGALGEAIAALEAFGLAAGDAVLVKGSNSVGLGRVVARFVDRAG